VTGDIPVAKGPTLPFGESEAPPPPPPLAVPLPRRRRPRVAAPGLDETRLGGDAPVEGPLPFATPEAVAEARTAASRVEVAPRGPGEADRGVAPSPAAPLPAAQPVASPIAPEHPSAVAAPPRILEPTLILPVATEPTLVLAPASSPRGPLPDLDRTMAIRRTTGAVVAFADAFGDARPEASGPLTLEEHAQLIAELTTEGDLSGLLMRHRLTAEEKAREDERWARELDADPSVRRAWMRHFAEARARLGATGEKS
jgi:hypothetical protein